MGLFTDSELDALNKVGRHPGVVNAIDDDEAEALEDVYWDNPDSLNQLEGQAIRNAVAQYDRETQAIGAGNDFDDQVPGLFHETRSEVSQGTDEAKAAPVADDWHQWLDNPDRFDWPGVDLP